MLQMKWNNEYRGINIPWNRFDSSTSHIYIYLNIYLFATTIDFQDVLQFKDNKQKVNNVYRVSIACHNKNDWRIILIP